MNREEDISSVMELYGASIYRMSYFILQNDQDAQDVLQETLIKYMQKAPAFRSEEHRKAWLFRVANNLCKDMLRFQKRNRCVNWEELQEMEQGVEMGDSGSDDPDNIQLLAQIFSLAEKYKRVIYLHYYEGYSVKEMAVILQISEGAVKKRLERGRNQLRELLEEDI